MTAPVVIIGAGLAGWTVARELRKLSADLPITLITADSGDFYAKPALSNALAQKKTPAQLVNTPAAQMAAQHGVKLLAHTRVSSIDRAAKQVLTAEGAVAYSQIVLATGAQPIRIPIQGNAAHRVLSVNSLADYTVFSHELLKKSATSRHEISANSYQNHSVTDAAPHRILIMGAGLIGCEFANDLAAAGHVVTVADPAPRALAALLPEEASGALQDALAQLGIEWKLGASVQRLDKSPEDAITATLSNGERLSADIVLSAIGLRPDLALAQSAGLATERGILVNAQLQTSDAAVYALGDGAQYSQESLKSISRPLPYVLPIMQAAKLLAANIMAVQQGAELKALSFPVMPIAIKTPALPLLIAPPAPGESGTWQLFTENEWQWLNDQGQLKGFALAGAASAQRGKWLKALEALTS
jgi:rubredoxin---NAD+ reductase